jgi:thiamine pyrophosphokinase
MALQEYLSTLPETIDEVNLIGPFFAGVTLPPGPKIFVDRGTKHRVFKEGFSVGDGDSHLDGLDQLLDPTKDYSDLAYVLRNLDERFLKIHLHGFLGGRRDHELMNLAEAHDFLKWRKKGTSIHFDEAVFGFSAGDWEFPVTGIFSIFAFEKVHVQLWGRCEYKLPEKTALRPLSSHGLSNIGTGGVNLSCSAPVFVFLNELERQYH